MTTYTPVSPLIAPYGGSLVDLMVPAEARDEVKARASQLSSLQLSERSVCDLDSWQPVRFHLSIALWGKQTISTSWMRCV